MGEGPAEPTSRDCREALDDKRVIRGRPLVLAQHPRDETPVGPRAQLIIPQFLGLRDVGERLEPLVPFPVRPAPVIPDVADPRTEFQGGGVVPNRPLPPTLLGVGAAATVKERPPPRLTGD